MGRQKMRQITPQEISLAKELQQYLRRVIAQKGIVIEENPSSNAVIGEIDGVLSHPTYLLRNKSLSAVMASINTDDPSVFNTNVANEHAIIYFSLIHHGYSVEEALEMIDALRKVGVETSFLDNAQPFDQLLQEYEQILRIINKVRPR